MFQVSEETDLQSLQLDNLFVSFPELITDDHFDGTSSYSSGSSFEEILLRPTETEETTTIFMSFPILVNDARTNSLISLTAAFKNLGFDLHETETRTTDAATLSLAETPGALCVDRTESWCALFRL